MKIARNLLRIFLMLTLVFALLFTLFFGRYKINEKPSLGQTENYKGILTVWQIDSFEGGTGSRKQFLLKAARSFERANAGVLVMVIEHTEQSLKRELENNKLPDLISFGAGVGVEGLTQLNIAGDVGGMVGDKSYATIWCRGGYTLIANPKLTSQIENDLKSIVVSQGEYTQPLAALYLEGINATDIRVKKPMDAYVEFTSGKTPYFLGTQRDIIRLERREMEVITKPLSKYNDIYQYIAVTSTDGIKSYYAQNFIEHLLGDSVQKSLNEIGMLSTKLKVNYDNPHLTAMQNLEGFATVSAFKSGAELKEMQENSLLLLGGKKELEIKIKNMLV